MFRNPPTRLIGDAREEGSVPRMSAKSAADCLTFGVVGVLARVRRGPAGDDGQCLNQPRRRGGRAAMPSSTTTALSRQPLKEVLKGVTDPRDRRGVRHPWSRSCAWP